MFDPFDSRFLNVSYTFMKAWGSLECNSVILLLQAMWLHSLNIRNQFARSDLIKSHLSKFDKIPLHTWLRRHTSCGFKSNSRALVFSILGLNYASLAAFYAYGVMGLGYILKPWKRSPFFFGWKREIRTLFWLQKERGNIYFGQVLYYSILLVMSNTPDIRDKINKTYILILWRTILPKIILWVIF